MESIGDFEYNTKDLIGHGAFAVVFKGRHKTRNTLVAIKSITKKNLAKSQNLLGKEIKILKELTELHHENVVALLDCKETAHHVYLVMEFCNGGDLADYLHAKGTLSEDTIRSFLRQIAGAMRALYQKGVVHRDLKPQNILLCHAAGRVNPPPTEILLKIADFGFARFLQDGVMAATLCGSPMYMAPEVIMSLQYDAKADLWSIGTIVFQCLTGKAPFQAQTPQALKQFYEKNANLVPKIPSDTSSDLTNLLMRLLKRNAKDRMEFDEFFNHPFLKPITKLSSPMPVPHRRGSSPLVSAGLSPTDVPPSPRLSSWGENPMEGASPQSRPQSANAKRTGHMAQPSTGDGGTLSSPDEQDFVFVPECVSNETSSGNICEISSHSTNNANTPYVGRNSPNPSRISRGGHHRNTEPVPVPTQREAYEQIQRSLSQDVPQASPPVKSKSSVAGSPGGVGKSRATGGLHESSSSSSISSEKSRGIPDLTSISPPSIQFVIGTPPGGRTRSLSGSRSAGTTPPPSSFIPGTGVIVNPGYLIHQTAGLGGPGYIRRNSLVRMNGNPVLSPILDFQQNNLVLDEERMSNQGGGWNEHQHRTEPSLVPFASQKRPASDSYGSNLNQAGMEATSPQNPPPFQVAFGSGRTFTLPDMSPHHHQQNLWPPGNEASENRRQRRCHRNQSESHLALSSGVSPPHPISRCSSLPSNGGMDGPLTFVAPELSEETLFERGHNETLAKLNFVMALVDCILELAESKATPFGVLTHTTNTRRDKSGRQDSCQAAAAAAAAEQQRMNNQANNSPTSSPQSNSNATTSPPILLASNNVTATGNPSSDSYRRAEQLVLYMRALQLLSSSLQLSKQEVTAGKLRPSSSVRSVLKIMKERFHSCLQTCKALDSPTLLKGVGVDPLASSLTADRLLYDHAIEMCQSAALKELFGNPEECFHHYQTAQILLHSLAQQVEFDDDRRVLLRYKDAVEKRLFVLQSQGFVCAYDATT